MNRSIEIRTLILPDKWLGEVVLQRCACEQESVWCMEASASRALSGTSFEHPCSTTWHQSHRHRVFLSMTLWSLFISRLTWLNHPLTSISTYLPVFAPHWCSPFCAGHSTHELLPFLGSEIPQLLVRSPVCKPIPSSSNPHRNFPFSSYKKISSASWCAGLRPRSCSTNVFASWGIMAKELRYLSLAGPFSSISLISVGSRGTKAEDPAKQRCTSEFRGGSNLAQNHWTAGVWSMKSKMRSLMNLVWKSDGQSHHVQTTWVFPFRDWNLPPFTKDPPIKLASEQKQGARRRKCERRLPHSNHDASGAAPEDLCRMLVSVFLLENSGKPPSSCLSLETWIRMLFWLNMVKLITLR